MKTTISRQIAKMVALLLLALPCIAHAQNEIIPNPDAVKLRRVWMVRGSVNGGERIGDGAGSVADINGDSITDFAWYFGALRQWNIQLGSRETISTTPYQIIDSLGAVPSYPVVGNFYGDGQHYIMFSSGYIVDTARGWASMRFPLLPYESDTISTTPVARLDPHRTMAEEIVAFATAMWAIDLDKDGDDELIVLLPVLARQQTRDARAEIWIFAGGPNFQLDTPTVVLKDTSQNDDAYYASVADIDGDSYAEIITGGIYKGNPKPARLNIWWGRNNLSELSLPPDRSIDLVDPVYPRIGNGFVLVDCDGDHHSDLWISGPDGSMYLYRMGIAGKDPRTRSLTLEDADERRHLFNYLLPYTTGYLNDSLRRYELIGLVGPDPAGGGRMVMLSGGANGPNSSYDAYYSPASDGLIEGDVFRNTRPLDDATGDGWPDLLVADPSWYQFQQGIAILLAGGPYIPNDDPTVSVREVATTGRSDALHLWPNPVRDLLHVAWRGDLRRMPARMSVYDMSGQLIAEGSVAPGRGEALWRCASVVAGTYILTIYDSHGEVIATEKILKE